MMMIVVTVMAGASGDWWLDWAGPDPAVSFVMRWSCEGDLLSPAPRGRVDYLDCMIITAGINDKMRVLNQPMQ